MAPAESTTTKPAVAEADLEYMRGWSDHTADAKCDLSRSSDYVRGWMEREDACRRGAVK